MRGLQNQRDHHSILTKYEAVHPADVSENLSLVGDAYNFDKSPNSMY